jgi:lipoate-protein ligase A
MAVDEAILEATTLGEVPPTLRLYGWTPPCLSLGYSQPFSDVDQARLQARDWEVVRRATGGRAILHTDELTYSVCGPDTEPALSGDIVTSYKRLSTGILAVLEVLGLDVLALPHETSPSGAQTEPVCFEIPSNYEITVNGKKLVGSAQSRRKGGVLQHGTLPLSGDLTRIVQALTFPDEAAREKAGIRLLERATTVLSGLGKEISWHQAVEAFKQYFPQPLNLDLRPAELTTQELARAEELLVEKYANPEWTERI